MSFRRAAIACTGRNRRKYKCEKCDWCCPESTIGYKARERRKAWKFERRAN